ncbi:MAG: hypothetical protein M1G31_33365 [Pseudanabaena sp. Salubria-1]|nr:hypothetical protein [Pseudanabaena sp. Salubria-1]
MVTGMDLYLDRLLNLPNTTVESFTEEENKIGSSGFMGISTANSNQNPLGATVTALPCRQ